MTNHSTRLIELAKENPNNVLEINLSGDNSIGGRDRTHILVTDYGKNWIEGKILYFCQCDDLDHADYKDLDTSSHWEIGRKHVLSTTQIASAHAENMLCDAKKVKQNDK